MTIENWTPDQGARRVLGLPAEGFQATSEQDAYDTVIETLRVHLANGKSIAYYVNEDLGHSMVGDVVALTFGTSEAQFEPEQFPDGPPKQMPDGLQRERTGGINWRYQLKAITPNLPVISDPLPPGEDDTVPTGTRVWIALDIAADGPAATTICHVLLDNNDSIVGWHIVNPANPADAEEFRAIGEQLSRVFEDEGPMEEMPFEQDTGVPPESPAYQGKIGEHLIGRHAYSAPYVATKLREGNQEHLVEQHNRLHEDPTGKLLHSHESLRPEDL